LPFLEPGYVAECLVRDAGKLSKECWSIISQPDTSGAKRAAKLEAQHWHHEFAEEALSKVASDMHNNVTGEVRRGAPVLSLRFPERLFPSRWS
jgi:hypothetical protein